MKGMNDKLVVLWTSADKEAAQNMVFMYTLNAKRKGWFSEVTLIVWGPSARLLTGDGELQTLVKEMQDEGIKTEACLRCAENYGVVTDLENLGIEVKLMGQPLTGYLKENCKVLTF
jgi:hypothetical protein